MPQQTEIKRSWLPTLLSGLALSIFGILIAVWPDRALYPILLILGGYLLFDGIVHVMKGVNALKRTYTWVVSMLLGAFQIILGVILFQNTDMSESNFLTLFATYLVVRGLIDGFFGFTTEAEGNTKSFIAISGIVSLLIGLYLFTKPDVSSSTFAYTIGTYGMFVGGWIAGIAMRMRSLHGDADLEESHDDTMNVSVTRKKNPDILAR